MFKILNDPTAPVNPATDAKQAQVDTGDLTILAAGSAGTGVYRLDSTGATDGRTFSASNNMNLTITAGTGLINGATVTWAADSSNTLTAPVTNPRFDLVAINTSGAVVIIAGAESTTPDYPVIPDDGNYSLRPTRIVLAAILLTVGMTNLNVGITDKRVFIDHHPIGDAKYALRCLGVR